MDGPRINDWPEWKELVLHAMKSTENIVIELRKEIEKLETNYEAECNRLWQENKDTRAYLEKKLDDANAVINTLKEKTNAIKNNYGWLVAILLFVLEVLKEVFFK